MQGSLAASGVVNSILLFDAFDTQVSTAAGPVCTAALQATTQAIEAALPNGVKQQFGAAAAQLSDDDFMYFIADSMAESVQYGNRLMLCQYVTAGTDYITQYVNFTSVTGASSGAADYNTALIANPQGGDDRSWWWQTCTEFGWFQVAPAKNSIRSARINLAYHLNACYIIFGVDGMMPDVNGTNITAVLISRVVISFSQMAVKIRGSGHQSVYRLVRKNRPGSPIVPSVLIVLSCIHRLRMMHRL